MVYPNNFNLEGFLVTIPPFFNGTDFNYWKTRMDCYLKSTNYDICYIVMHGDIIPGKKIDDIFVEKTHEDLDDKDKIMISKNAKAKNSLICGLDRNIYNRVDQASSAHKMWRIVEVIQQGTSSMKETKINILVQ